jgi:hypothetical protein
MSTSEHSKPDSTPPEELVGYLDGELSPEECRRVEERLASDADYRQQLHDLDQAWEALDALPSTAVDDNFARTTIEMVALAAERDAEARATEVAAESRGRWRRWALAGAAVAMLAFLAARLLMPDLDAGLLADLPVIRQMDELTQIENVDFLRRLSATVPLDQLAADPSAVEREFVALQGASAPPLAERRKWIESLSPDQQAQLAAEAKTFETLPESEHRRLRELEREIAVSDDVEPLRKTMLAYGQWLARRSPGEQDELRGLAIDDRIRRIEHIVREEDRRAARRLSAEDEQQLREEIFEIAAQGKDDFLKAMRRRDDDDRHPLEGRPPAAVALVIASWELRNEDTDDRTRKRLVRRLSNEAQEYLEKVGRRGRERRRWLLWQWMHDAMRPNREPGELEKFFATELSSEQRERLLSLPKNQMEAELERLYLSDQFGLRGVEWLGSFNEPRRPIGNQPRPGGPGRGDGRGRDDRQSPPPNRPLSALQDGAGPAPSEPGEPI